MKQLSRVVWSEGMYLGPHQFQVQNRFFEDVTHFDISSLWFEPYGFVGLELDSEALRGGTVSVVHARGFFPDGLPFFMPENDPLPAPRNIADLFPPARENLTVLLALPPQRSGGMNCELDEAGGRDDTRYVAEARSIPDENTGLDEKPVRVGRKNIRILLDTEDAKDLLTLPVARVMRDGSGNLVYDKRFIPPCVQVGASESLLLMARRLIEILEEKSAVLAVPGKGKKGFQGGLSAQEIARFWFLHAINSSLAPLRQFFFSKRGHPEELFVELSRLAGALCTFGMDSHPRSLPLYNHLALDKCFEELDRHIRTHLEIIIPTNCVTIPLQPAADYFFEGEITDLRCLDRSNWIFAIHSPIGDADVVTRTVQLVKVCSAQFVPELVRRALPGMTLTHMPVPPSAVSPRVEYQYFGVSKAGPCWDHINQTRRVGVYVPGDLPSPEVELLVVLQS